MNRKPERVDRLEPHHIGGESIAAGPDGPRTLGGWSSFYFPPEMQHRVRRKIGAAMRELDPECLTDSVSIYRLSGARPADAAACWNRMLWLMGYENGESEPLQPA